MSGLLNAVERCCHEGFIPVLHRRWYVLIGGAIGGFTRVVDKLKSLELVIAGQGLSSQKV